MINNVFLNNGRFMHSQIGDYFYSLKLKKDEA